MARSRIQAPRESTITAAVMAKLRLRGAYVVKIHGSPYGESGVPDLLCCYRGCFLGLEVKRPGGGGPSSTQRLHLERIAKARGVSGVVRSAVEAEAVLDSIDSILGPA